ncbi:hypothetical protein I79_019857 [Cricetulus griseus]|uniref:Uncharacterized protein n=1 Tax=Cricetulus griseus TaxID=10029 RepID=G3I8I4_CRIGR|nr:hypothetical protein I79_019857 [Cricetulus griseus]
MAWSSSLKSLLTVFVFTILAVHVSFVVSQEPAKPNGIQCIAYYSELDALHIPTSLTCTGAETKCITVIGTVFMGLTMSWPSVLKGLLAVCIFTHLFVSSVGNYPCENKDCYNDRCKASLTTCVSSKDCFHLEQDFEALMSLPSHEYNGVECLACYSYDAARCDTVSLKCTGVETKCLEVAGTDYHGVLMTNHWLSSEQTIETQRRGAMDLILQCQKWHIISSYRLLVV